MLEPRSVPVSTRNSPPPILIAALNRPMSSTQSGGHYFTVHLAGTDLPVRLRVRTGPVSTFRQQGNANDGPAIIPIRIGAITLTAENVLPRHRSNRRER
jgi:hypothetical protein